MTGGLSGWWWWSGAPTVGRVLLEEEPTGSGRARRDPRHSTVRAAMFTEVDRVAPMSFTMQGKGSTCRSMS
ncbi:hypothetical protein GCM10009817_19990 [Terrabacter lapilli]|uniref:Uncharacterized protein n=1 Tax=Terrabacter lapilli TaxID=436231 RepID=A0ABN2S2R3_9MICO